ncbi:hypothetical protein [Gottfriedia solisilvae]|uniref:hypothetical protein n=1 Tax=Gottfriedia solisilvae TaxID=1516104 RepID=UPI003D2F3BA0
MTKNQLKITSNSIFILSVLLIVAMLIDTLITYRIYLQHPEWSAPFSAFLLARVVYYGIPVIVGLLLSFILNKKAIKQ